MTDKVVKTNIIRITSRRSQSPHFLNLPCAFDDQSSTFSRSPSHGEESCAMGDCHETNHLLTRQSQPVDKGGKDKEGGERDAWLKIEGYRSREIDKRDG